MRPIYFNKYNNWEKDITYSESDRKDLSYYTIKWVDDKEYDRLSDDTKSSIEEVKNLINNII